MNFTFATRDMIRALRVLAPALSRGNQDRIYAAQIVAKGPTVIIRALNDTWEARSAVPATIEAPGEVWLPGDTLRRLPWGTLGETVRMRRARAKIEVLSQGPTSETFTAETMNPPATKGLPQGTKAAASVPGTVLARLLRLGSIATLGKDAEEHAVFLYTSGAVLTADAWDGTWLSRAAAPTKATHPIRVALPPAAALSIAQAAGMAETVTILANPEGTTLTLAAGTSTLTTRVFAAKFPDTTLIPTADANAWDTEAATASLALAVRHALAVAGTEHAPAVTLEADSKTLTFRLDPAPEHGRLAGYTAAIPATTRAPWTERMSGRALARYLLSLGEGTLRIQHVGTGAGVWLTAGLPGLAFSGRLPAYGEPKVTPPLLRQAGSVESVSA
jgi:DNA polymerase III sliding clamp (beta) subunit (PCNA family)